MKVTRTGATSTLYETATGTLRLSVPTFPEARALTIIMQCAGHGDALFAEPITSTFSRVLSHGKPTVFDDWEAVTSYDSGLRLELTKWTRANETKLGKTHILVRSRFLAMGVAVANMALGGSLVVYSARDKFEREIHELVPSFVLDSNAKAAG